MAKYQKNELDKSKRIKQVMDMMGKGMYMHEIVSTLMNEWECSDRSVYKYITIVRKMISKEVNKDVNDLLNKFNTLYSIAVKRGDIKTANQILQNIGKFSVGEKQNIEHSGELNINININESKYSGNTDI
jgi:hypothetical protein